MKSCSFGCQLDNVRGQLFCHIWSTGFTQFLGGQDLIEKTQTRVGLALVEEASVDQLLKEELHVAKL